MQWCETPLTMGRANMTAEAQPAKSMRVSAAIDTVKLEPNDNCAAIMLDLDKTVQGLLDEYWKGKS